MDRFVSLGQLSHERPEVLLQLIKIKPVFGQPNTSAERYVFFVALKPIGYPARLEFDFPKLSGNCFDL